MFLLCDELGGLFVGEDCVGKKCKSPLGLTSQFVIPAGGPVRSSTTIAPSSV